MIRPLQHTTPRFGSVGLVSYAEHVGEFSQEWSVKLRITGEEDQQTFRQLLAFGEGDHVAFTVEDNMGGAKVSLGDRAPTPLHGHILREQMVQALQAFLKPHSPEQKVVAEAPARLKQWLDGLSSGQTRVEHLYDAKLWLTDITRILQGEGKLGRNLLLQAPISRLIGYLSSSR